MDLTIVISHTEDKLYLDHNLDIMDHLGFDRKNIWVDGFRSHSPNLIDKVGRVSTHTESHGARTFDLLSEAPSEFVIILDSDFFCTDKSFWTKALNQAQTHPFVSLGRLWYFAVQMLTTPFVTYHRKEALGIVPDRKAWNHFDLVFDKVPNPVFDHLQYVFLSAMVQGKTALVDTWDLSKREHSFCHLWDSRHGYEENFSDFEKSDPINRSIYTYMYLAIGIEKYFFHFVSGIIPEIEGRVFNYMATVKKDAPEYWFYVQDVLQNLGPQISFKPDWAERFALLKKQTEEFLSKQV